MDMYATESFGPTVSLMVVDTEDDAIALANETMRDTVGPNDSVAYMSISLVTPSTTIGRMPVLTELVTDAVSRGATLLFGDANSSESVNTGMRPIVVEGVSAIASSSVSTTMRDTVGPNDSVAYMSISLVTPSTTQ
jgi:hypothetical protein